jgi:chromosome segregation ATPase
MITDKLSQNQFDKMGDDINDLKLNVGELKINVGSIKEDISEMKDNVTNAVDRMSETLVVMAGVTEKLNHNMEEHKTIHGRIDGLSNKQEILADEVHRMKTIHKTCSNRRQLIETEKKNSAFQIAKKRISESIYVILFLLLVFIAVEHAKDFITYIQNFQTLP